MFTVYVGPVGSGKTYAMVRAAKVAYEQGETVFANMDLDVSHWQKKDTSKFVRWHEPVDLLEADVRCGTVLFDELGEWSNNRETDTWPVELTIKLIEHRKDHLDFHASVQDDELADKNLRRFYNRVFFVREHRWPFLGLWHKAAVRPDLKCDNPNCTKGDGCLTKGDKTTFPWPATWYSAKDVHPQDTKNKYKHRSQGVERYWFDAKIALAFASGAKASAEAMKYYRERLAKSKPRHWRR